MAPDRCVDDALFINTTGGWVKGRENFAKMIAPLHAPGGPFHDHTRRHEVEELRFVRPDVAIAAVRTFDIRRAGVPTTGEETRGLILLSKEGVVEAECPREHVDSGNRHRPAVISALPLSHSSFRLTLT